MSANLDDVLQRYSGAASGATGGKELPPDAAEAWSAVTTGSGRLGSALVRDSARRRWSVAAHRDSRRGRFLVVSPVQVDAEPFRASADGYRPDAYLRIGAAEWTVLALLAWDHEADEGRDDEELRNEAFRVVSRIVVEAQHEGLMGAGDDEDEDE